MPKMKFGATGKFPQGKLNEDDEGAIQIGIAFDPTKQIVMINFGTTCNLVRIAPRECNRICQRDSGKSEEIIDL